MYDPFILDRMCGDPHLPDLNGGVYDWPKDKMKNNRSPFGTKVTYGCVPGAKFTNAKTPNQTQTYTCQWDQLWSPSDPKVNICQVLHKMIHYVSFTNMSLH